jgi:hypothetical protein
MNRRPETATWKVTADPRGTLTLPNAAYQVRVPVGTLQIDAHLAEAFQKRDPLDIDPAMKIQWPVLAPGQRYQAVLYIEKEGFEPLLEEARIAERYDLAVISCKGQSVVAARKFADTVCAAGGGVPLLVVHDMDKAGFEISQRLTTVSDCAEENDRVTYRFKNDIDFKDLGLRLADATRYGLTGEECEFEGRFANDSIATEEEKEFLRGGRRIELNEFTSPQFLEWLEGKLQEHLPKRLVPRDEVLADAYRRALAVASINRTIKEVSRSAVKAAAEAKIPHDLRELLERAMKDSPQAWDKALYDLALVQQGSEEEGEVALLPVVAPVAADAEVAEGRFG